MRTILIEPNAKTGVSAARSTHSTGLHRRSAATASRMEPSAQARAVPTTVKPRIRRLGDLEMEDADEVVARRVMDRDRRRIYETRFMDGGECILAYDPSGRLASALRFHDDD